VTELLTFKKIHQLTEGTWLIPPKKASEKLRSGAFDTRDLGDAQIFFAWKGETQDGHTYIDKLRGSGIRLAIVEKSVPAVEDIAILVVKNSLEALHKLANYLAKKFQGKIITITGSSGKTTAKSWLNRILSSSKRVLTNIGSFNNQIGCPITILNLNIDHEIIVLEMGTSGLGELELLSSMAPADISILLNVGHAHIGMFGSRQNIYRAKAEIFAHQKETGLALVPYQDEIIRQYLPKQTIHFFGKGSPDFSWESIEIKPKLQGQVIQFETPWGAKSCFVNQLGEFVGEILSALIATCHNLGLSWDDIEPCLENLPQEKGRSTIIEMDSGLLVLNDTYNANPESTINMLKTLCTLEAKQYIAVVGNLAELEAGLTESAPYIINNFPDKLTHLILSGETGLILMPQIQKQFPQLDIRYLESVSEINRALVELIDDQTVLGVKGSRSAHMERVVYALQNHYSRCDLNRCGRLSMCRDCEEF
jgi:UDP-N-acetylmuramoyl-tripeptide--D-alanyl-D-alanine ligase